MEGIGPIGTLNFVNTPQPNRRQSGAPRPPSKGLYFLVGVKDGSIVTYDGSYLGKRGAIKAMQLYSQIGFTRDDITYGIARLQAGLQLPEKFRWIDVLNDHFRKGSMVIKPVPENKKR